MRITDTVLINKLVWIRSLRDDELGPSVRMLEDIEAAALLDGMSFRVVDVADGEELDAALLEIEAEAKGGVKPFLHFDCHGSAENGLLLEPSQQFYSWERLNSHLRSINVATENNLCCCLGLCFGLHYAQLLELGQPTPFFLLIAAEEEVSTGFLEENLPVFYREMLEKGDIVEAYNKALSTKMPILFCKKLFAEALAVYVKNHCRGRARDDRRERLLTRSLAERGITRPNRKELRRTRRLIRNGLAPTQRMMNNYAKKFLLGRSPDCNIRDIKRMAGL